MRSPKGTLPVIGRIASVDRAFNGWVAEADAERIIVREIDSMHRSILLFATLASLAHSRLLHVAPTGTASATGSSTSDALDLSAAIGKATAGDTLLLVGGTYSIPFKEGSANTIVISAKGTQAKPILCMAPVGQRALVDFSFPRNSWVQDSYGFSVKGDWWDFRRISITRAGYQGAYVVGSHNRFENCAFYENRNSGLEINKGGSYTTVINCDAYRNYDPKKSGTMADGFAPKQAQGPGNNFHGCRAWENSDDGFDTFQSTEIVTFDSCWAFRNGLDVLGYGAVGNGNGFKVGGDDSLENNVLRHCVAFGNPLKGFDQNSNTGGMVLEHCTGYLNKLNFSFGGALAKGESNTMTNCVSFKGASADVIANTVAKNNSWNLGIGLAPADFESLDTSLARAARTVDGKIPNNSLLRPSASSKLLDKGAKLQDKWFGDAPDLGAFERPTSTGVPSRGAQAQGGGNATVHVRRSAEVGVDASGRAGSIGAGFAIIR